MAITLKDKMKGLSPARRKKIEARTAELVAEEMTLCELRKAMSRTQTTVGQILGIGQEGVSRIEQRSDLLLSTLRSYVEAMGGNLSLIVKFPDREPVSLSGIALDTDPPPPAGHKRAHAARA
jgi:hypothetical protein